MYGALSRIVSARRNEFGAVRVRGARDDGRLRGDAPARRDGLEASGCDGPGVLRRLRSLCRSVQRTRRDARRMPRLSRRLPTGRRSARFLGLGEPSRLIGRDSSGALHRRGRSARPIRYGSTHRDERGVVSARAVRGISSQCARFRGDRPLRAARGPPDLLARGLRDLRRRAARAWAASNPQGPGEAARRVLLRNLPKARLRARLRTERAPGLRSHAGGSDPSRRSRQLA